MGAVVRFIQRAWGRVILGGAAVALVAVVAASVYVFGGGTAPKSAISAPTLPPATSAGTLTFTIDAASSEATFTITERHFGQPTAVVGTTNHVAGQMQVNPNDPAATRIGQIKVDVSTLATDSSQRNDAIQGRILETAQSGNQFATFTTTSISGLPATFTAGQAVALKLTGNLTIHSVTRPVTFDATVTGVSTALIKGEAHATIAYADYGIAIPQVPSVSDVGATVVLAVAFQAKAG
jgi:polyisoprenoid-binding protein YceI